MTYSDWCVVNTGGCTVSPNLIAIHNGLTKELNSSMLGVQVNDRNVHSRSIVFRHMFVFDPN